MIALLLSFALAAPVTADPHAGVRDDVQGTASSVAAALTRVRALDPLQRAELTASMTWLVANCPYTRAALRIPAALDAAAQRVDGRELEPRDREAWEALRAGLAEHVALVEALGVGSAPTDELAREIAALPEAAAQIDAVTQDMIALHSARVEAITGVVRPCPRGPWAVLPGQPWTLGMQLAGWGDVLAEVGPGARGTSGARIGEMSDLLETWGRVSLE